MNGTPEDFARAKPRPDCLSHWQLSRWVLGVAQPAATTMFAAHVAGCEHCRDRYEAERAMHAAAAQLPLPLDLRDVPPARARWRWPVINPVWAYALAAMLVLVVLGPSMLERLNPAPGVRLKGAEALVVARLRDGVVLEGPWREMQPMQPRDQVRFKAHTGTASWQALYMRQQGRWQKLFAGPVAADDWVPTALTVNAGAPNALRLVVCPAAPAAAPEDATVPEGCAGYDASL